MLIHILDIFTSSSLVFFFEPVCFWGLKFLRHCFQDIIEVWVLVLIDVDASLLGGCLLPRLAPVKGASVSLNYHQDSLAHPITYHKVVDKFQDLALLIPQTIKQ